MAWQYSSYVDNVLRRVSHNPTFKWIMTLLDTMRPRYNKLLVERTPNIN